MRNVLFRQCSRFEEFGLARFYCITASFISVPKIISLAAPGAHDCLISSCAQALQTFVYLYARELSQYTNKLFACLILGHICNECLCISFFYHTCLQNTNKLDTNKLFACLLLGHICNECLCINCCFFYHTCLQNTYKETNITDGRLNDNIKTEASANVSFLCLPCNMNKCMSHSVCMIHT